MPFAAHPVRRVAAAEGISVSPDWPHTIPAVRQLLTDGLDLGPGVRSPTRRILPACGDHARLLHLFNRPGFYCLDEPESALSFSSSLAVVGVLNRLAESGSQVLCATHSPVIAALPGATILEVGGWGIRKTAWSDLQLVEHWRAYLDAPGRYLRHVIDSGPDRL